MRGPRDPNAPPPAFASMLNALAIHYGPHVAQFAEREFNEAARRLRVYNKEQMERRLAQARAENEAKWQVYKKQD
jgi:hypothetical protein